jgi:hypothetical protein
MSTPLQTNEEPTTTPEAEEADGRLDLHELLSALLAVRGGDFTVRLPGYWTGIGG